MAWRPYENLIEGELDNTVRGRVTGWLRFVGMAETVRLDLQGDFHRDIRGAVLRIKNPHPRERCPNGTLSYMEGFSPLQSGAAGDITAGLPPRDYVDYPYVEWYADNGRVVLELDPDQVELVGRPFPWAAEAPLDRMEQAGHLARFLRGLSEGLAGQGE